MYYCRAMRWVMMGLGMGWFGWGWVWGGLDGGGWGGGGLGTSSVTRIKRHIQMIITTCPCSNI